jgi:hypothetical protein
MSGMKHHLEKRLDDGLRTWVAQADTLIARRLGDAGAHIWAGRLANSELRLSELKHGLIDLIENARGTFLRDSFNLHPRDPAIHNMDVGPTDEAIRAAREAPIAGHDVNKEIDMLIQAARTELANIANRSSAGPQERIAALGTWQDRHRSAIKSYIVTALSDSQMALFHAVGHLLVKPEMA